MKQTHSDILEKARRYYESATANQMYYTWKNNCIEDFGFYDGTGQWTESERKILEARNQPVVTNNKIKAPINSLAGIEVQTRFRTAFRSRANDPEEAKLSEALTALSYYIQEDQDVPYKQSLKFLDHLVCGMGWSQYIRVGDRYVYEYVHPTEMVFDPEDLTPQFTNSTFVCRVKWLPLKDALEYFPNKRAELKRLENQTSNYNGRGVMTGEVADRYLNSGISYTDTSNASGTRIRVVEVQYKVPKILFGALNKKGNYVQSFEKEDIESVAQDKKHIDKKKSSQIHYAFFTDNVLLDSGPLEIQPKGTGEFSYVPLVMKRRYDGVPYGLVADAKSVQREANKRRSKALHVLTTQSIEADKNALAGMSTEQIRQEAGKPDSVFLINPGSYFKRTTNSDIAEGQFKLLMETDKEIQQSMGIYSEQMGDQTNAQSGIAIQERQRNSVRNHVFAFDNLRMMKKREGRLLLSMLQSANDTNILAQIVKNGELIESLILNRVIEKNGNLVIENDIKELNLDVYVEEVKEFESPSEEQAETLKFLLEHPQGMFLMQSPELMKRFGFREGEKIAEEIIKALNQQQPQMVQ